MMFSGLFGKGDKNAKPPVKGVAHSRELEVTGSDTDTVRSLVGGALAEQNSRLHVGGPVPASLPAPADAASTVSSPDIDIGNMPTRPLGLDEMTPEQRKDAALHIVESHHQRVANTIRTLWGYKECSLYINKLIMNGGDGMGHARIGFNQNAVEAMLVLADIHDTLYGPCDDPIPNFADTTRGTSWGKFR